MNDPLVGKEFEKWVTNKFNVYNSLFLNLPYPKVSSIGKLIPLVNDACKNGLESGKDPLETLDAFFATHTRITSEREKIDFMFRVVQYVERQVVLYDSVEDAAFDRLLPLDKSLSLDEYLNLLISNKKGDELSKRLSAFSTRIVFTAHPTQFYPPSALDIIARLKPLITHNDINEIDLTLRQLGLTSLMNAKKPTPFDEAKNIIYFLRNVYYDAVAELYAGIKRKIEHSDFDNPDILQFGFWPGGDRDGNPYVTAETTNAVADELRMTLMKCYYQDVKNLQKKLTFKEVADIVNELKENLYPTMFDPAETLTFEAIINPLYRIRKSLTANYNSLYVEDLENLIDKVKIFRTHFATIDVRQNHIVHQSVVEQILKKEGLIKNRLDELGKDDLVQILLRRDIRVDAGQFEEEIVNDTIRNIAQLKDIQKKNGEEGCNRYIISHSEDIFSVLFVYGLLRWCGWDQGPLPVDIIPLFESMEGLSHAPKIMAELFELPGYRAHVRQRNDTQTIMVGFSDGTKDGGYLKANWSIFKSKENLSAVCEQYGIRAIFFDGRGGPPARGGGKTQRFYAAQTKRIANHAIQLTIQGQTISSRYGTREQFLYNCEQLISAGLSQSFAGKENTIPEKSRHLIEDLAEISYHKYQALKNHKMFIPYLENRSTLKYYSRANIGSRPAKRGNKKKLNLDDLRAISFVGSWSQLKQNVPGYFGVGTALQTLVKEGKLEALQKLFKEVPFFRTMILNSMMSLSKCYFELTRYIAEDEQYKDFWNILYDEYKLSKEMTLLISQFSMLMEEEPVTRRSVKIREDIVLPLLVIQQYALQKIEQDSRYKDLYQKIVTRSLYGNINASRNSA